MDRILRLLSYFLSFVYYKSVRRSGKSMDVLFSAVSDLGGLYIKLIQFICLHTDVFADADKMRFLSFYDSVPIENIDVDVVLQRELGPEKMKRFSFIENKPFASGTFGQVYKATLYDDTAVVIKVLRPNLRAKLFVDFVILKLGSIFFSLLYQPRTINVRSLVSEFEELTYKELDYVSEARNAEYFYTCYRDHPYVVIPKTFTELTTATVMVQEYIGGVSVSDLVREAYTDRETVYRFLQDQYQTDMRTVIVRIVYEIAMQGFTESSFYADPHPGNIKVLPGNTFAFIDFGIVGESPRNKRNYYNIINLLVKHADDLDTKRIGEEFLQWGARRFSQTIETLDAHFARRDASLKELILNRYAQELERYRERFREIEAKEEENFSKMYMDIIRAGEIVNVVIPQGMLASLRTIAIYKAWVTFLDPQFHFMRGVYNRVLETLKGNRFYNEDDVSPEEISIEEALEEVLGWVGKVAESDMTFYRLFDQRFAGHYV